jgi:hypothetical protein
MGRINLPQTTTPSTPSASTANLFVNTSGVLCVQLPNGTVYPVATTNTAQTFSAAQTFGSVITSPGTKPASDGTASIRLFRADGVTPVLTVDTTNSRVITAGDVFPFSDTSGVMSRVAHRHMTPTDHFTAFSGWTWASDAVFSGAPSNILIAVPSFVRLHNTTTSTNHFAHQVISSTGTVNVFAAGMSTNTSTAAIRIDDGTDNNYIELQITPSSAGSFFRDVAAVRSLGGSVTTVTAAQNLPAGMFGCRVQKTATEVTALFHPSFSPVTVAIACSHTWTATRAGLILRQSATTANQDHAAWFDWIGVVT